MAISRSTPGVYITEVNAFPTSVVPVATAVPAFIGYTAAAVYQGKSLYNCPTLISSYAEFQAMFMLPDAPPPDYPAQPYSPQYYLVAQSGMPAAAADYTYVLSDGVYYSILPDPATIFYLYNSVRLFFLNGGTSAYIVAVGPYGAASGKALAGVDSAIVNPHVQLADLQRGLTALLKQAEPTMYLCPDATLLSLADNATLMQAMLAQAVNIQTAVCLFDVIGAAAPNPVTYPSDIENFRNGTGNLGLNYGICYYPFIGTTVMQASELDFTNLFGGDATPLAAILNPPDQPNPAAAQLLAMIQTPPAKPMSRSQLQAALLIASPVYSQIMKALLALANTLPASAAMAGVYTLNDNTLGVWNAPANMPIGAQSLPINLSNAQQDNLNIDAVSGKSINAIRSFPGQGILIWGARTLDGNSQDWRYISVRRTMIFLEQSIKLAARAYVFEPNNATTWAALTCMINSFLTGVWQQGGLVGASPNEAFHVSIGLGTTMTADDILNGIMNVSVQVAVTHPAEFIVITFQQLQASTA